MSGSDVIFNKKITVAGAADKIVTYIEDGSEKFFTANATVVTIDASVVLQPLEIFGNKKANVITGSDEDDYIDGGTGADKIFGANACQRASASSDTLIGGKGNDSLSGGAGTGTLRGGDGSDIFVYKSGDVTFAVDDGQIIVKGGASKYIPIYYGEGNKNVVQKYIPRS